VMVQMVQTGLGNFAHLCSLDHPWRLLFNSPITRYMIVGTDATDRRTDVFLPPEDAQTLGLGEPVERSKRVQVAGDSVHVLGYPTLVGWLECMADIVQVRTELVFPDGQKRAALLRASSFMVPAGGKKIPTVRQYVISYTGLNLLKVKVYTEDHSISSTAEEEEEELAADEYIGTLHDP